MGENRGQNWGSKKLYFSIEKWAKIEKKVKNFVKKRGKKVEKSEIKR